MPQDPTEPAQAYYRERIEFYAAAIRKSEAIVKRFGAFRGLSFLAAGAFLICGLTSVVPPPIGYGLGIALAAAFLVITFFHENADRRLEVLRTRERTNQQAIARIKRDWNNVDIPRVEVDDHYSALAKDLDLFDKSSLFQLVCVAKTPIGRRRLAQWILDAPSVEEILKRQQAAQQLADQKQLREDLQVFGNILRGSKSGPDSLLEWCESDSWFVGRYWVRILAIVMAVLMGLAITVLIFGIVPRRIAAYTIMGMLVVNFFITVFTSGSIHWIFRQVASRAGAVDNYVRVFELARKIDGDADMLAEIRGGLSEGTSSATADMRRLNRVMSFANMRTAGALFLVYLIVQFFFIWDVHILWWLERWKDRTSHKAKDWFDAVANWEALSSLSQVVHDHPHWVWPEFVGPDDSQELIATQIGHPLLDEDTRVNNDAQLGPPGRVLLVTGSNMSGKSTLLRSIGINVTLAQAGCVVSATKMSLPSVSIETSMRISDSLASGVSFFMAELRRLKEIVDRAKTFDSESPAMLLYLLDEILQGTNSTERHIAVQRVLQHLLESRAIGAISTHDLDLATAEGITDRMLPVHFRESFSDGPEAKQMTFDYQLRQGVATTTNALKLLELVGLKE